MDVEIYRGSRFFEKGMFNIRLHQKPKNKFLYLPAKRGHERHTISNYVCGELKRYIRSNSKEISFLAVKVKFFRRLLERGLRKWKLKRVFHKMMSRATPLFTKSKRKSNSKFGFDIFQQQKRNF